MNDTALPSLSVILATWRREEPLRLVLGDLARQEGLEAEIVVVDQNAPPTPSEVLEVLQDSAHRLTVLRCEPGVVAARNKGARKAEGEVLVFIDDDVRIDDRRYLEKIARNFTDPSLAGLCGQELSPPDYAPSPDPAPVFAGAFEEACFFPRASTERREAFHLVTCNCAVRRRAWEAVGGLDLAFAGNSYGDDYDLALRMRAAGLRIVFEPSVSVRHTHAPMGGLRLDDPCNPWSEADRCLSLWVFYLRHVPSRWRRWYLHHGVLRKTILLKTNATKPWRWPAIVAGLWLGWCRAKRAIGTVRGAQ